MWGQLSGEEVSEERSSPSVGRLVLPCGSSAAALCGWGGAALLYGWGGKHQPQRVRGGTVSIRPVEHRQDS